MLFSSWLKFSWFFVVVAWLVGFLCRFVVGEDSDWIFMIIIIVFCMCFLVVFLLLLLLLFFSVLLLLDRGVTYPHSTAARRTRFEGKYTLGLSITTKTKLGGGKQHTAHTAAFKTHNVARNLTHTLTNTHARSYDQPNHSLPHIDTLVKNTEHAHLTKRTHSLTLTNSIKHPSIHLPSKT